MKKHNDISFMTSLSGAMSQAAIIGVAAIIVVAAIAGVFLLQQPEDETPRVLTIATTTSLYATGLLEDAIGPAFKDETGIELHFIAKGTGAAIQLAKDGGADAILVHARSSEQAFLEEGYGVDRKIIAYNYFAIVGPASDPAHISGMTPTEALAALSAAGENGTAVWASRDDASGTNTKEINLWDAAGFTYDDLKTTAWFRSTGSGMGATLTYCENEGAYTLADMGTYLKYFGDGTISLDVLVDEGEELINIYAAIPTNPETMPDKDYAGALMFTKWLVSDEGQDILADFGVADYGRALFNPAVEVLESGSGDTYEWVTEYGFIEGTECPSPYRHLPFYEE